VIPPAFIQELLARVDIVDVVGRQVRLKKSGSNWSGLCPFHAEKSPSFTVSPTKQFYHCFGCGANGDAIRFLVEHDDKLLETAEQQFSKLTSALQRLHEAMEKPEQRTKVRQVMKEAPELLTAFRAAAKVIKETDRVSNEVNGKLSSDIIQIMNALRASQAKTLTALKASSEASVSSAIVTALTASGVALVAGLLLAWFIGRGITRPVISLTHTMDALARGDLETEVAGSGRRDELGQMAKAVLVFRDAGLALSR